jgi:protein SCO1/2
MNETAKSRIFLILCLFFGLLASACGGPKPEPPLKDAAIGGPFTLTDQNGRAFRDSNLAGKYAIVYFGFSHCPDVCPTDLASISQALRGIEADDPALGAKLQPVFITVDPERDTPSVLKQYVAAFHPRLIGLTGSPQQIADAAKKYAVYYAKQPTPDGSYTMDHLRIVFLMGPDGQPIAMLPYEQGAEAIATELRRWVQ